MIRYGLALAAAMALGTMTAQAESMISPNGINATGSTVQISAVTAEKDGYVVIHRTDFTGTLPGTIIGHAPVKAGENAEVAVTLDSPPEPGTKLIVMLHEESDGDTAFGTGDKPATSGRGPVQQIVTVQ